MPPLYTAPLPGEGIPAQKLQDIICYEELEELLKTYLTFFIEIAGGFEELVYDVDGKEAEFLQFSCLQYLFS